MATGPAAVRCRAADPSRRQPDAQARSLPPSRGPHHARGRHRHPQPRHVAAANQIRGSLRGPLGAVLNIGRRREAERDTLPPLPTLRAPRTPFNARITAHRKFAFRSTPLSRVKEIKTALGATVNDVVMAACAGGLRTYLDGHDVLPEAPLVAMVPVSIRTGEEEERWTNRVSGLLAMLPTDEADP
ncbi:MAG: wax ester/triacylglycerol synthase domain-containing protein, partial [Acidimicrobiales bacterium]